MTKQAKTISRAPDLEDPYSVVIRIMLYSMIAGFAMFGIGVIGFVMISSWGDPFDFNFGLFGVVQCILLAYSVMSIREEVQSSRFMVFL